MTVVQQTSLEKIRKFVSSSLGDKIEDEANIFESGLVSSMFGMQLINFLENSFSIRISDEDLVPENFNTVHNIHKFLLAKSSS